MNIAWNQKIVGFSLLCCCICLACAYRPGSKSTTEEAASEQVKLSGKPEVFAADYIPSAGIQFQPTISNEGTKTLNVEAALTNVRAGKLSDLGKEVVYQIIGDFEDTDRLQFLPIEEGFLAYGVNGIWLLDKNMKQERMLFRNDVQFQKKGDFKMYNVQSMLQNPWVDDSTGFIRFICMDIIGEKQMQVFSIVTFTKDEFLASDTVLTQANVYSKMPLIGARLGFQARCFGMKEGYCMPEQFTNNLLTFSQRGDTLCRFTIGEPVNYSPTGTYRGGESATVYYKNGIP